MLYFSIIFISYSKIYKDDSHDKNNIINLLLCNKSK